MAFRDTIATIVPTFSRSSVLTFKLASNSLPALSTAQATVVNTLNRLVRTQSLLSKPPVQANGRLEVWKVGSLEACSPSASQASHED